ncbi:MAG: TIGR02206 family membrane protein [Flavobacteriales bacterium]|nr:TIGR02206 family membrane protein [Flavobacteriales bacterium]
MDTTIVIDFLSNDWIKNMTITVFFMLCYFFIGFKIKDKHIKTFMKISSLLVLFMTLSNHIILLINDSWTLKSNLPIHLCSVSALICCFIGFTKKNQLLFEFLFYAGIIGGLLSILTPQITLYNEYYFFYIMFYFKHASIIAIPLFMRYGLNMKLTKFSWLKVFGLVNLLLLFVLPINTLIDSNYLYVSRPPMVNNPLIIEDLNKVFGIPTYVFYWEIILIVLVILFYYVFRHKTIKAAK